MNNLKQTARVYSLFFYVGDDWRVKEVETFEGTYAQAKAKAQDSMKKTRTDNCWINTTGKYGRTVGKVVLAG